MVRVVPVEHESNVMSDLDDRLMEITNNTLKVHTPMGPGPRPPANTRARILSIGELQELCYSDPQEARAGLPPPGTEDPPLMGAQTAINTHHRLE